MKLIAIGKNDTRYFDVKVDYADSFAIFEILDAKGDLIEKVVFSDKEKAIRVFASIINKVLFSESATLCKKIVSIMDI